MARCNQGALLAALGHYRRSLEALEAMVAAGDWRELQRTLERTEQLRPEFL
jgi:arogenate dehydrogenase (NADP+)